MPAPASTSPLTSRAQAAHLLLRATFGPAAGDIDRLLHSGTEEFLERQLAPEPEHDELAAKLLALQTIEYSASEFVIRHQRDSQSRASVECPLDELRTAKLMRAVHSQNQLREVMTDFWYNHFNVYAYAWEPSVGPYERETIRPNVFGKFRDLLRAVSKSLAMMYYLDTYISTGNRMVDGKLVRGLNENYGRELLELHTVGVAAGYGQHDVTEAARCFTGWDFGGWHAPVYGFRFAGDNHDRGAKAIFGLEIPAHGGESDGDRLVDYLAAHPATAQFVSWRIVQRFVADDPPATLVAKCGETFRRSDGSIADVLRTLFTSDEFNADAARRTKVKSPLEFVAGAMRATGASIRDGKSVATFLGKMGMPLYECKPPTGYSNRSTDWINVSAQLYRMNFAIALATNDLFGVRHDGGGGDVTGRFERDIIGGPIDPRTRAIIAKAGADKTVPREAKQMALLLASPPFQMR